MASSTLQQPCQTPPAPTQQPQRDQHVAARGFESPYLDLEEAAVFLRFSRTKHPLKNTWAWIRSKAIPTYRRGRTVLVRRDSLEAQLRDDDRVIRKAARHG